MPSLQGEPVARAIRAHQTKDSTGWKYRDLVEELHVWVDRFDQDFNLGLPTPVIAIASSPKNILATYRLGHSDIGARTTVTFNERWLPYRSFSDTVLTLMHECLHAHEEHHLGRQRGGWYHTKAWREKMEDVGIIADEHGITARILPRFVEYIGRYYVPDFSFTRAPGAQPTKQRQLPKWVCACQDEKAKPARAVRLRARCLECGQVYRKTEL